MTGSTTTRRACLAILVITTCAFVVWPIAYIDADLWYHLAHGREVVSGAGIPTGAYFSFAGERPYVDYYWLFQVLAHGTQRVFGWQGLVVLRAAAVAAILTAVLAWLFPRDASGEERPWAAILLALLVILLLPRLRLLRPHLAGYLFIPLMLRLLDARDRRVWLAPVIALLWVNLHGVAWPILASICGAHLVEIAVERRRDSRSPAARPPIDFVPPLLGLAAILATPHGLALTTTPFIDTDGPSRYIFELAPVDWRAVPVVSVRGLLVDWGTARIAILAVAAAGAWIALRERPLRLAHLIVALAGAALFTRGLRFSYEAALLFLPLLARVSARPVPRTAWKPVAIASALAIAVPVVALLAPLRARGAWPLSHGSLPEASAGYLAAQAPGTVFNDPNIGGFLQHEIPMHRIFANLESPFLFNEGDVFVGMHAWANPNLFRAVVDEWHPTWFLAPRGISAFATTVRTRGDYWPVYVDETSVVYVDVAQRPDAAVEILRALDPHTLRWPAGSGAEAAAEIERLLDASPHNTLAHVLAARLALEQKDSAGALEHAKAAAAWTPESPLVQEALGDAHLAAGDARAAWTAYCHGERLDPTRPEWLRKQAVAAAAAGDADTAYRLLLEYSPPFAGASDRQLFDLAVAAREAGRLDEARRWARFAWLSAPLDDRETAERIRALRASLGDVPPGK